MKRFLTDEDLGPPLADDPRTLREAEQRELLRIAARSALANGGEHLSAAERAIAKRRAAVKPLGQPLTSGEPTT